MSIPSLVSTSGFKHGQLVSVSQALRMGFEIAKIGKLG